MSRKEALEHGIRECCQLIREYEEVIRLSDNPKERTRARYAIEEQKGFVREYLAEYIPMCERLGLTTPQDILEAATVYGVLLTSPPRSITDHPGPLPNAYALLVGVGDYLHPRFANLPVTIRDAQAVAEILADPNRCAYPPANIQLLTGPQATRANIRDALQTLAQSTDDQSTVSIYFSGHGGQALEAGIWRTYLCPREADPDDLGRSAISGDELSEWISDIPAQRLLVILDACHAAGSADLKAPNGSLFWKKGLPEAYYETLSQGSGRVVIASSKEDQFSYIRPPGDLSLFTYHLCQALGGKAAVRDDGLIRVLNVFHFVNEAVHSDEPRQTPILKIKDLDLNFAIALDQGGKGRHRAG